jgi:hypothetical protein
MNVYQYIAQNNPDESYQICQKYGYFEVADIDEMSDILAQIVANQGESALKEILSLHPDREVILEVYSPKPYSRPLQFAGESENLPSNVSLERNPLAQKYFNADGETQGGNKLVNQTNLYILVGAMIVSLAIISIKK